jgi:type II secretory pathway pseudopilin PulG
MSIRYSPEGMPMVRHAGFTLLETIITVVGILFLLFCVFTGLIIPWMISRQSAPQLKDSTQVRAIHQGMVMWAQNNRDEYPLPSRVDLENATVPEEGRAKDTTANIVSLLVFNGSITPEILVSPVEANRSIRVYKLYEYDRPRRAVRPDDALWDPGLSADFTSPGGGHISYAHLLPVEPRLARWSNTFVATEAIVGNRGPEILSALRQADGSVVPTFANPRSYTFRMHGPRDRWNGNIAFNDNHVEFRMSLTAGTYTNAAGQETADLIHYDEPDDPSGLNHFLGIFIRAGERREDWRGIWD